MLWISCWYINFSKRRSNVCSWYAVRLLSMFLPTELRTNKYRISQCRIWISFIESSENNFHQCFKWYLKAISTIVYSYLYIFIPSVKKKNPICVWDPFYPMYRYYIQFINYGWLITWSLGYYMSMILLQLQEIVFSFTIFARRIKDLKLSSKSNCFINSARLYQPNRK